MHAPYQDPLQKPPAALRQVRLIYLMTPSTSFSYRGVEHTHAFLVLLSFDMLSF